MASSRAVGLDFGTTNSALAVAAPDGTVELARFKTGAAFATTFRSILYFDGENASPSGGPRPAAGPQAIEAYLSSRAHGRLIQSLKSYLPSRLFRHTNILGRNFALEDLIAMVVQAIRAAAEAQFGDLGGCVVVGRPVHFSGAKTKADDEFALGRLRAALAAAGFDDVIFQFEPVAAALQYQTALEREELVLIADFGGGTSDFSLVRLARRSTASAGDRAIVGTDGVGIAGDTFDSRAVRRLVAPALGLNSKYQPAFGAPLPIPSWLYEHLEKWHYLSFLKAQRTMELLEELKFQALAPEKIAALIHVVENDSGYRLYRSIEQTKFALTDADAAAFAFADPPVVIHEAVARGDFESWIARDIQRIADCVDRLFRRSGVSFEEVDSVFMTGGTSLVPAVKRLFECRFGAARIKSGEELTSVAKGLALEALSASG
ncbi:MAG TPA: Hsp70 family protein [Candidatus Binatia bacterium]|nr:Hsp70 family protein [Candidatus Binatia bacterium]